MSDSAVLIWFGCVCNESGGVIGAGSVCIQLYIQVSVPTRLFLLHLNHSSHLNIPKMYYGCLHTPPVTWSAYNRTGFSLILRKLKRKRRFIDCGLEVMMDLTDEQDIRYFLEADVLASATKQIRWNGGMLQKRWSSELRALGGFKTWSGLKPEVKKRTVCASGGEGIPDISPLEERLSSWAGTSVRSRY